MPTTAKPSGIKARGRNARGRNIRLIVLAIGAVIFSGSPSLAQTTGPAPQSQSVQTNMSLNATSVTGPSISTDEVKTIRTGSMRQMINDQIASFSVNTIAEKLQGTFEPMTKGTPAIFTSKISADNNSIAGQNMVKVKVSYEARPIGGILTVRVDLVPLFPGIGSASRSAATLEKAEAVEYVDEDMINQVVADLTHQLGKQYASR